MIGGGGADAVIGGGGADAVIGGGGEWIGSVQMPEESVQMRQ